MKQSVKKIEDQRDIDYYISMAKDISYVEKYNIFANFRQYLDNISYTDNKKNIDSFMR